MANQMWCGNPATHPAHYWGVWEQHYCRGKGQIAR